MPQTSRSPPVGMSLRCLAATAPSGPRYSWVLYTVLPAGSRSLTPIDTHTPACLAAAPMAAVAGEGTTTAWSSRPPNHSPAVPHGVDRHTQSG